MTGRQVAVEVRAGNFSECALTNARRTARLTVARRNRARTDEFRPFRGRSLLVWVRRGRSNEHRSLLVLRVDGEAGTPGKI